MAEKTFLDHAAKYAYQQLDKVGGDLTKVEPPLQTVAIIYTVQGMFDNGGFRYIFENDFPFSPPYSLFSDAYRRIGAIEAADLLDKAVAISRSKPPSCFKTNATNLWIAWTNPTKCSNWGMRSAAMQEFGLLWKNMRSSTLRAFA